MVDGAPIQPKYDHSVGKVVVGIIADTISFDDNSTLDLPDGTTTGGILNTTFLEVANGAPGPGGVISTRLLKFGHAVEGAAPVIAATITVPAEPTIPIDADTPAEPDYANPEPV